jgi:hypothetical protein
MEKGKKRNIVLTNRIFFSEIKKATFHKSCQICDVEMERGEIVLQCKEVYWKGNPTLKRIKKNTEYVLLPDNLDMIFLGLIHKNCKTEFLKLYDTHTELDDYNEFIKYPVVKE